MSCLVVFINFNLAESLNSFLNNRYSLAETRAHLVEEDVRVSKQSTDHTNHVEIFRFVGVSFGKVKKNLIDLLFGYFTVAVQENLTFWQVIFEHTPEPTVFETCALGCKLQILHLGIEVLFSSPRHPHVVREDVIHGE